MRPDVSYIDPWQGQNQPPNSPLGSPGLLPSGTQPRWVQTPIWTSHSGRTFLAVSVTRELSVCGSRSSDIGTASASLISSGVRWRTNSGLPRHFTVTAWPTAIGWTFTSTVLSASVSAAGLRLLMKGQAVAPMPTAPRAPVATMRKSRRVGSPCPPVGMLDAAICFLFPPPEEIGSLDRKRALCFKALLVAGPERRWAGGVLRQRAAQPMADAFA